MHLNLVRQLAVVKSFEDFKTSNVVELLLPVSIRSNVTVNALVLAVQMQFTYFLLIRQEPFEAYTYKFSIVSLLNSPVNVMLNDSLHLRGHLTP